MHRAAAVAGLAIAIAAGPARAFADVGYSGGLSLVRSRNGAETVYLFNSLDVRRGRIGLSFSVPVVMQQSVPEETATDPSGLPVWRAGLADPIVRVEALVAGGWGERFAAAVSGAVKVPVASVEDGWGTGECDAAIGVTVASRHGDNVFLADATYWLLADAPGLVQPNVTAVYAGYARTFGTRRNWSAILSVSSATSVVPGAVPPAQVSLGAYRTVGPKGIVGVVLGYGLTGSAPRWSVGTTWRATF